MSQEQGLSKFAWTCLILQSIFGVLFILMVRYDKSAMANHVENQLGKDHDLKENLEKYPGMYYIVHNNG